MTRQKQPKAIPEKRIKPLWRIVLNYSRMVEIHHGHYYSEEQALDRTLHKVAKAHDVSLSMVRGMFNGEKDNFKAEIDAEWAQKTGYKISVDKAILE